jgi:ribonuclease P protein component
MNHEADLSAEQPGACTPPRFPCTDGDGRRPGGDPRASGTRSQEAVGVIHNLLLRRDFLAANAGKRAPMPGFVLLVHDRQDGDPAMRVGFTVTKKVGNAVVRNRMKRRMRALARELVPEAGIRGADHVLIGRDGGIERDHALLKTELAKALAKIARGESAPARPRGPKRPKR